MSLYERIGQRPNLLQFTKDTVQKIANEFKGPDADFVPALLIRTHNDDVLVVGLKGDMDSQSAKDDMAEFMLAACACARAKEAAFVSSCWALRKISKDDYESGNFVMPRDSPDRIEAVSVMYASLDGDVMATREIIRRKGRPPTLAAEWEEMRADDGTTLGGRFGNAVHQGIEIGKKMAGDETPPEIKAYMDEMIAADKFNELIEGFLRGKHRAYEEQVKKN
jgi:hypothetical protein